MFENAFSDNAIPNMSYTRVTLMLMRSSY